MSSGFLLSVLAVISVLTSLAVEGIKKILDERNAKYNSNILAVLTAFAITILGSYMYIIYNSIPVTPQIIVTVVALAFLSFLSATIGYDKLIQALMQLGGVKND